MDRVIDHGAGSRKATVADFVDIELEPGIRFQLDRAAQCIPGIFHLRLHRQCIDTGDRAVESSSNEVCQPLPDFLRHVKIRNSYLAGITGAHGYAGDRCRQPIRRSQLSRDTPVHGGSSWPVIAIATVK